MGCGSALGMGHSAAAFGGARAQRHRAFSMLDDRPVRACYVWDRFVVCHPAGRHLCRGAPGAAHRTRMGIAQHGAVVAGDGGLCGGDGADSARRTEALLLPVLESFGPRSGRTGNADTDRPDRSSVRVAVSRIGHGGIRADAASAGSPPGAIIARRVSRTL